MLKPGKLYRCPDYFLMIYPSKEKASARLAVPFWAEELEWTKKSSSATLWTAPMHWMNFLSEHLGCQVRCSELGEIFMFLEKDEIYLHVLFGGNQGWILFREGLNIEKVSKNGL